MSDADRLYKAIHGTNPQEDIKVRVPRLPRRAVALGVLHSVVYLRPDGDLYEHKFSEPQPILATNVAGTQLVVVGGMYFITARGIEK